MLHECLFHFQKNKKRAKFHMPFPYSFKGARNRTAASKLARLIDPAYSNRDWLICQPVKTHFLTEPTSPFIGRLRNPIRSSAAKSTRTAPRRQPLFLKIFRFLQKPLILLGEIDAGFFKKTLAPGPEFRGAMPAAASAGRFSPRAPLPFARFFALRLRFAARPVCCVPTCAHAFRPRQQRMKS